MSFDTDIRSIEDAELIESYLFIGGTLRLALTTSNTSFDVAPDTFLPSAIARSQPTYSIEKAGSELQIIIAQDDEAANELVSLFVPSPPEAILSVAVKQHTPTGDRGFWGGFVVSSNYNDEKLVLLCRPLSDILTKTAPRRGYGRNCQHVHYDARCSLTEGAFTQSGAITAIDATATQFTVPGISAASVRWDTGTIRAQLGFEQGMIIDQTGDVFTTRYPILNLEVGEDVFLIEGCKRDATDCAAYNNAINYGGFLYTPDEQNPFEKGLDKA
jgi:hypothetical protein